MAQKTDLNVSPYFDDFSSDKNFYKVLFNPGRPIQARELTTLQSILQNQLESFGSNIFQEGSVVVPGNIVYDSNFNSIKLNPLNFGIDVSLYVDQLVGKTVVGETSGVTAVVQFVALPDNKDVTDITIYVKYSNSDTDFNITPFLDGESLTCLEDITYGLTTITAGTVFASLISLNASSVGSSASIGDGIYFIRGYFVKVNKQTIILDYYTNTPSYRVGLRVTEDIVTPNDDPSLFDNAKGFNNFSAPGADRFKISLTLSKKSIDDINDVDFVEILRVEDGRIKKLEEKSNYSIVRDYLAQRTYDESGDYAVEKFNISLHDSLNDRLGNDGLFFDTETTSFGNEPSDDLLCVKISPGKAYVRGYDINKLGTTILDVEKPRDTRFVPFSNVFFEMGNLIKVNNVYGTAREKATIGLYSQRRDGTTTPQGTKIGDARVYKFSLTDESYISAITDFNLYLYDVQTYTTLTLDQNLSNTQLPATSFVKGKSSGATGYAVSAGNDTTTVTLRQTSGSFLNGESIIINGVEIYPRSINGIVVYSTKDIKSAYQAAAAGFTDFICDVTLENTSIGDEITIRSDGNAFSPVPLSGVKVNDIIRYNIPGISTVTYNRVAGINVNSTVLTLNTVTSVPGLCLGDYPTGEIQTNFTVVGTEISNQEKGYLYSELVDSYIESLNLSNSTVLISSQITGKNVSSNSLTLSLSDVSGITSAFFQPYINQRYSVHYSDGTIDKLTSDQVVVTGSQVQLNNLDKASDSNVVVNVTLAKNGLQSKIKQFNRSRTLSISLSKNPESGSNLGSSINDGLTYNQYYGLRVQDEEICLNYPDVSEVISVYESLDSSDPVLDKITFNTNENVTQNAIIGENFVGQTSKAIGRVVSKPSGELDTLSVVYLSSARFLENEFVIFKDSNIVSDIKSITAGRYKDITNNFALDKGQRDQYYDYSRLVRGQNYPEPARKLFVVFDYYSVPSNDRGDVFTVLSYDKDRYTKDIPLIGSRNYRSSDVLDFRPQVPVFTGSSSSPFDFSSRNFGTNPKFILAPDESSTVSYSHYLPRIDKVYLDKSGDFIIEKGVPSVRPREPVNTGEVLELATISLPPYLFKPSDGLVFIKDNQRFTMRDIGDIKNKVDNLEKLTSLSLLELSTQTLQVQDAQGFDRFKTGFFVDDFKNYDLIDLSLSTLEIDPVAGELVPFTTRNTLESQIVGAVSTTDETLDLSTNFELLDSNVVKSGNLLTLNYEQVQWIRQPLATKVENVNPFNVIAYIGTINLSPESDSWVRTVTLPTISSGSSNTVRVNQLPQFTRGNEQQRNALVNQLRGTSQTTTSVSTSVVETAEVFMRSRNTQFTASNLKPLTRYYQFFDNNSEVDFVPKLLEISPDASLQEYGSVNSFIVGETVIGFTDSIDAASRTTIRFRVANSNHKFGPYNNPTRTYNINPYARDEDLPTAYSPSSKVLNIDTESLSSQAQGLYGGFIIPATRLVGQTSGAVAYVKDIRLITDNYGDLIGTFFLRDPNTSPPPPIRINTGTKTYRLTSSSSNALPLPGSTLISFGETTYRSEGTLRTVQSFVSSSTTNFIDPLAQSFTVGGNVDTTDQNAFSEDRNGAFITSLDLYFASKDTQNNPVTVQIRTVELSTPTRNVLGRGKVLYPDEIQTSPDASVPTRVTFDFPIYLAPGQQYAIVLLAPQSDEYEVWVAEMGQRVVNSELLPFGNEVIYSRQFSLGRLYKSQNGAEWTGDDFLDLKFTLYKARFTSQNGTAYFQNPSLDSSNDYVRLLGSNPILTIPKSVRLSIDPITDGGLIGLLSNGRKISESTKTSNFGFISGKGGTPDATVNVLSGGSNYAFGGAPYVVSTYPITGSGSGLTLTIAPVDGVLVGGGGVVIDNPGSGYDVGDVVGIVTSSVTSLSGSGARIGITSITNITTITLDNVQGGSFTNGSSLVYVNNSNQRVTLGSTTITASSDIRSGGRFRVSHFNHGMYAKNNKVEISNVLPNYPPISITAEVTSSDSLIKVAAGDTSSFGTFEGLPVSATNPGYILVGGSDGEIISYQSVGVDGTITVISRGEDSTIPLDYNIGTLIYKYELNGISLRRINTTHDLADDFITYDGYSIDVDLTKNGVNRSADNISIPNSPKLCFNSLESIGGNGVRASENIHYDSLIPRYDVITPGSLTSATVTVRTVSGTSIDGQEVSFVDQGFEPVQLNQINKLSSTRIVCSRINETTYLTGLPRNKSFTTAITLETADSNLSPAIIFNTGTTEFRSNIINRPVLDYITDGTTNTRNGDLHAAVYVSNVVRLQQQAKGLKVILTACRPPSADLRVLYSLIRPDSSEIDQSFELFPGYRNLTTNINGELVPIDSNRNDGTPDSIVPASLNDQFLEYEYTADNLDFFTGYQIKVVLSGTDQANPPRLRDIRTIALR